MKRCFEHNFKRRLIVAKHLPIQWGVFGWRDILEVDKSWAREALAATAWGASAYYYYYYYFIVLCSVYFIVV